MHKLATYYGGKVFLVLL